MKLSQTQKIALAWFKSNHQGQWFSAYECQQSLSTLNALHRLGLLDRKYELGYMAFPRTSIQFRLRP